MNIAPYQPTSKTLNVFAIQGAEPEAQAYAMAKYSRSALSFKEAIAEITSQKAEDFLNTFYFQYGHKSIADLAHVPLAIENLSLLAAIEVVDEQLWDGQERSTRYQDFSKREYFTPTDLNETETAHYHATMNMLFDAYDEVFREARAHFLVEHPIPDCMDEKAYQRTINARAFDVARYLLPMATMTSVGQITSARRLEGQISRMLASEYSEVRDVAEFMKAAVTIAIPYNVRSMQATEALRVASNLEPADPNDRLIWMQVQEAIRDLVPQCPVVPTLVKYAEADKFKPALREIARSLLAELSYLLQPVDETPLGMDSVVLADEVYTGDKDLLTSLLYEFSDRSYGALRSAIQRSPAGWVTTALQDLLAVRGPHDELPRGAHTRAGLNFEITMDLGGYRDLHRHRRVIHFSQEYTTAHGFSPPEPICNDKLRETYLVATRKVKHAFDIMRQLREMRGVSPTVASYLLPLGTRHRFLMKMDVAEAAYIAELRTTPAGHISYRKTAWSIYQILREVSPALAESIKDRVTDPSTPLDFFKR